jgi:hypothetical protein
MKIKDKRDDMNKNSMDKAKEQAGSAWKERGMNVRH